MLASTRVWFSLWKDGAFRIASFDPAADRGALVEGNGRGAMRMASVSPHGVREVVTRRQAVPKGVRLATSELIVHRDGIK